MGALVEKIAPIQQAVQQKLELLAGDNPLADVLDEQQAFLNLQQALQSLKPPCRLPIKQYLFLFF